MVELAKGKAGRPKTAETLYDEYDRDMAGVRRRLK